MNSSIKLALNILTLGFIGTSISTYQNNANAINALSEGWQVTMGSTSNITTPEGCFTIVNPTANSIFIATMTLGEWTSFKSTAAGQGIGITPCATGGDGGGGGGGDGGGGGGGGDGCGDGGGGGGCGDGGDGA